MRKIYKNPKVYTFRPEKEPEHFEISTKGIWILVILLLLTGLVYFFLFSSYFKIKNVYIVGAEELESKVSEIIQKRLTQKSNIFLFSDNATKVEIAENFSIFSKVEIEKGFPDALKVELVKREPVLICNCSGDQFLIDVDGIAFKADEEYDNLPTVEKDTDLKVTDKAFSSEFVAFVRELWENFPAKTHLKIEKILVPETDFVIDVYTDKGWRAIFDTTKNCAKQLDNLALILPEIGDQKIEYVDLRLKEKIYYK